jgi:hypothetical protein
MGLSSSKTKTTTSQNTNQNGSTSPTNPPWVTDAIEQYTDRLGAFGDQDPNSFVAGASPLQRMAWDNAGSLADWQPQARAASQMASDAGSLPAHTVGPARTYAAAQGKASSYEAPRLGDPSFTAARSYQAQPLGPPAAGAASTYDAPGIDAASLVKARGYSAPALGAANAYAAPRIGQPAAASASGAGPFYQSPTNVGEAAQSTATEADSASLLDNFGAYQNPYQHQVVDAAMADFDDYAGRQRAMTAAAGARAGAFGGSRFALQNSELEGNLSRARNATLSSLLSQGFDTAAGLSQSDAANRQQTSLFNAQNATGNSQANAALRNQDLLAQSDLTASMHAHNADIANNAAQFTARANNDVGMFNAGQDQARLLAQAGFDQQAASEGAASRNQFDLARAGFQQESDRFNAQAGGEADSANASAQNARALALASLQAQAGQSNAANRQQMTLANLGYQNQYGLENAAMGERAAVFNAQSGAQSDAANQAARNQFALTQAGMQAQAGQYNAGNAQQMGLANMAAMDSAAQYNGAAGDSADRFNAQMGDAAAARQLQAAGMLADIANQYGTGVRADLGLMGQLGDQQRGVEAQYAMAPLAQLQALGQLYGTTPYSLFSGNNVSSNETMQGMGTVSQTPSLFNQMLAAASVAAKFVPVPGG